MPKGRDFNSILVTGAGRQQEAKLGGPLSTAASAGENRWIIDGIETTDVQDGTQGKCVIVDFVEEVQVKSSGYTAEFGGATGGVINASPRAAPTTGAAMRCSTGRVTACAVATRRR